MSSRPACAYCGKGQVDEMFFVCNYCGDRFCGEHRIPETHRCTATRRAMNVPTNSAKSVGGRSRSDEFESIGPLHFKRRDSRPSQGSVSTHRYSPRRRKNLIGGLIGILLLVGVFGTIAVASPPESFASPGTPLYNFLSPIHNFFAHAFGWSPSGATVIDSAWVRDFFGNLSAVRQGQGTAPLQESQTLDQFAQLRFDDLVSHYQITHYNYDRDFTSFFSGQYIAGGEEYFYPSGYTSASYVSYLQTNAPVHYQGLLDGQLSHFGYYIGPGPIYYINQPCSAGSEIVGQINQTQSLEAAGCTFNIGQGTWLVVELSS